MRLVLVRFRLNIARKDTTQVQVRQAEIFTRRMGMPLD